MPLCVEVQNDYGSDTASGSQERGVVAHRTGEGVLGGTAPPLLAGGRSGGHAAARGFQGKDATARGRDAQRAAAVIAVGHGHQARGHRGCRTAAGALPRCAGLTRSMRRRHSSTNSRGEILRSPTNAASPSPSKREYSAKLMTPDLVSPAANRVAPTGAQS